VTSSEEFANAVKELLSDESKRREIGENGYAVVQKFRGAVEKNMDLIEQYIVKDI
jgi:3-deoxy-D-manno-octulosonic-acid transferase